MCRRPGLAAPGAAKSRKAIPRPRIRLKCKLTGMVAVQLIPRLAVEESWSFFAPTEPAIGIKNAFLTGRTNAPMGALLRYELNLREITRWTGNGPGPVLP